MFNIVKSKKSSNNMSILKNPFKSNNIRAVTIRYGSTLFPGNETWSATVYFQNGGTKGEQDVQVI